MFDLTSTETKEYTPLADGIYEGFIEKAEIKKTTTGTTMIKMQLRLGNKRVLFDNAVVDSKNPKAIDVGKKKIKSIITNAIAESAEKKATFKTIDEVVSYIKGLPVTVKYAYKGKDEKGYDKQDIYYNAVDVQRRTTGTQTASTVKGPSY